MARIIDFTPTEEQFGVFWKYLEKPDVTELNFSNGMLWITSLWQGRYAVEETVSEKFLTRFITAIANAVNKPYNSVDPVLEADTKEFRISVLHPSIARTGVSISIRKSPPVLRNTAKGLLDQEFCSEELLALLINCVQARMVIVNGGEPNAGKTEFAKFLMKYIPAEDRVITIEDSLELHYGSINPAHDWVALQVRDGFGYKDAIKVSLRQSPSWLIMSEARSAEVVNLVECWSTGVAGITTIHLSDVRKLPDRMVNMAGVRDDSFVNQVCSYVDVGVLIRMEKGCDGIIRRYLDQMCFYTRSEGENQICMIFDEGRFLTKDIPVEVAKRFKRAGIVNPYRCEQLERDLYRNAEQKGDGDGKAKKKKA